MFRYSSFSEFYHQKLQQDGNVHRQPVVNGSLAEEVEEKCHVVCRAPSRTWWEQGWQLRRR